MTGPEIYALRGGTAPNHGRLDCPRNPTMNTVPRGDEDKEYFMWHVQIVPRLTTPAGFEMGSGMSINTVLPEDAAEYLKGVEST
jgi:UDPglucose--hexose-1-phosphate uridylyltransferase